MKEDGQFEDGSADTPLGLPKMISRKPIGGKKKKKKAGEEGEGEGEGEEGS